jgi:hypothetical protein
MLRDNLAGLIGPMLSSAGVNPLALCIARKKSSDDRPPCLENPRPEGAESTLTENAPSPFPAEPKQVLASSLALQSFDSQGPLRNCGLGQSLESRITFFSSFC